MTREQIAAGVGLNLIVWSILALIILTRGLALAVLAVIGGCALLFWIGAGFATKVEGEDV